MKDWERFVLAHGFRALAYEMAHVLGRTVKEVERVRATGACTKLDQNKRLAELFALWHGRAPEDSDWPKPRKLKKRQHYEWQTPEFAFLASLVGQFDKAKIAKALTRRLRQITDDPRAKRVPGDIQMQINRLGLQTSDVVGGITARAAAKEIGSYPSVFTALRSGELRGRRIGVRWVIPRSAWEEWKAKRVIPPTGYVPLARIRQALGINSDAKLPEYASCGYIPTAIRCNPSGTGQRTTRFGTWYIDRQVARKLVSDRRAGRPMPWFGKPNLCNMRKTFTLWTSRKHPSACKTCRQIWGTGGAPEGFEDYQLRYPPLEHGAKRHLTMKWSPGMTVAEVATHVGRNVFYVRRAIDTGLLIGTKIGRTIYVSKIHATQWKARRCPAGGDQKSWISLSTAQKQYFFTEFELRDFITQKKLPSKIGTNGPMRGVTYVARHRCGQLRQEIGYTEYEGARRAGVSVAKFRTLLAGVNWRGAAGIPLATISAAIKRLESREGYTLEQAAEVLKKPLAWVNDRILDGTVRVSRAKWDRRRRYLTEPMMARLQREKRHPKKREILDPDWLLLTDAANEAGISTSTLLKWVDAGEISRRESLAGMRYHRKDVRARARRYWKTNRLRRAVPPDWMRGNSPLPTSVWFDRNEQQRATA